MFSNGATGQDAGFPGEQSFGPAQGVVSGRGLRGNKGRKLASPKGSGRFSAVRDELRTGIGFALGASVIQAGAFLAVIYLFPTHVLILPTILMSVLILIACLTVDKRFAPSTGRDQTAFRVAAGYGWLAGALLFSIVGLIGGKIFSCVGKKNCTTDYMFDMMKMYAVIAIVQGVFLAAAMAGILYIRRRKMIEARKTVSIHIAKPKNPGT